MVEIPCGIGTYPATYPAARAEAALQERDLDFFELAPKPAHMPRYSKFFL